MKHSLLFSPITALLRLTLKSIGASAKLLDRPIAKVELLGSPVIIRWKQGDESLVLETTPRVPAAAAAVSTIYGLTL